MTATVRNFLSLALVGCLASAAASPALAAVSKPHPGLTLVTSGSRATLVIDLCAPGLAVRATKYAERKKTAAQWGPQVGVKAAINADFFDFPAATLVNGRARGAGEDWPPGKQMKEPTRPYWQFAPNFAGIQLDGNQGPVPGASDIVGAHVALIDNGTPKWPFPSWYEGPLLNTQHRRTAIGMSKDQRTMVWTVVNSSVTGEMLGNYLLADAAAAGAPPIWWASNVDGGGSSQLWVQGPGFVVPSTRLVANHLGVYASGQGAPANCKPKITCNPHCEGTVIVGEDCGKGNCAAYGASCVDDDLGVRCVSAFCPAKGAATLCLPDAKNSKIGTCSNGAIGIGECSAFGALCSTAGGKAHCASGFCVNSPTEVSVVKDVCLPDAKRYVCDAQGGLAAKPCPFGQKCATVNGKAVCQGGCTSHCEGSVMVAGDCGKGDCAAFGATCVNDDLGLRCASVFCPAKGEATVCLPDAAGSKTGTCKNGAIEVGECGVYGAWCSTAYGKATCVNKLCAASPLVKSTDKDVCHAGKRYHCTAAGGIAEIPCPGSEKCVVTSGGAAVCLTGKCTPHCEGTVLVGSDCGKGDCGAFAASCVDDSVGVRCASNFCPSPKGAGMVCLDFIKPGLIGSCSDGALATGECGVFGALCSTAAPGVQAKCVSAFCVAKGLDKPVDKDVCLPDGKRYHCTAQGDLVTKPCPAGAACQGAGVCQGPTCAPHCEGSVMVGSDCAKNDCAGQGLGCVNDSLGLRCVHPACPAQGVTTVCLPDPKQTAIGYCNYGQLQKSDCATLNAWCAKTPVGPGCVAKLCAETADAPVVEKALCLKEGRFLCSAAGELVPAPCPWVDGSVACNACGGCGVVPVEVCNGLDDDCDGATDDVPGVACEGPVEDPDAGGGEDANAAEDSAVAGEAWSEDAAGGEGVGAEVGAGDAADAAGEAVGDGTGAPADGLNDSSGAGLDGAWLAADAKAGVSAQPAPSDGCSAGRGAAATGAALWGLLALLAVWGASRWRRPAAG